MSGHGDCGPFGVLWGWMGLLWGALRVPELPTSPKGLTVAADALVRQGKGCPKTLTVVLGEGRRILAH